MCLDRMFFFRVFRRGKRCRSYVWVGGFVVSGILVIFCELFVFGFITGRYFYVLLVYVFGTFFSIVL